MDPRRKLSAEFVERLKDRVISEPVPAKDASTVVLMRDTAAGAEVYLLNRHTGMEFAGGYSVFPGGGVDPRDFDHEIGWAGPEPAEWARVLDCNVPRARALVCAAVRETFEESGILLAGPTSQTVIASTTGDDWEADRQALEARKLSFTEFLMRRNLVLRTDLLRFWGRWVTPDIEPKRYDTRFFVAALPSGQETRDVSTESDGVAWMRPAQAIAAADQGEIALMPPTYCTCLEIAEHFTSAGALDAATRRSMEPVRPELVFAPDGTGYLELPDRLVELGERWGSTGDGNG